MERVHSLETNICRHPENLAFSGHKRKLGFQLIPFSEMLLLLVPGTLGSHTFSNALEEFMERIHGVLFVFEPRSGL